jgi:hypothetical protein
MTAASSRKGAFDANWFFDHPEASTAIADFVHHRVSNFSGADPLGVLYWKSYVALDSTRKPACFGRLVRVAVDMHRYSVMDDVRTVYQQESDSSMRSRLLKVLTQRTPSA